MTAPRRSADLAERPEQEPGPDAIPPATAPMIDTARTMTDVAARTLVPTLVAEREGLLDRAAYDGADASDPVGTGRGWRHEADWTTT